MNANTGPSSGAGKGSCASMDDLATRFHALFRGSPYARGVSTCKPKVEGGTNKGGYVAHEPASIDHWRSHLTGGTGLGVFAATDTGRSWFGAIDIDDYKMDKPAMIRKVYDLDICAIPCNSKSGGLHIYFFFDEAGVRTNDMRAFMKHVVHILRLKPETEVFPKQDESTPKQPGNWINVPYFGGSDRYAYDQNMGRPVAPEDFLDWAVERRQSAAQLYLNSMKLAVGGPKCIADVFRNGTVFGPGVRHEMRKKYVAYIMEKEIENKEETCMWFANLVTPGDPYEDVLELIRGWENQGFKFACFEGSCKLKCGQNKTQNGPTSFDDDPKVTIYDFEEPICEFAYPDKPAIRLNHADFLSPAKVKLACAKYWRRVPKIPKDWDDRMDSALQNAEIIKVSESSSAAGELMAHVEKYCRDGTSSQSAKERGSWVADDRHEFTVEGLMRYLESVRFRSLERRGVVFCLLQQGAQDGSARINSRVVETLSLSLYEGAAYTPPAKEAGDIV